jgi:hypothetical protein
VPDHGHTHFFGCKYFVLAGNMQCILTGSLIALFLINTCVASAAQPSLTAGKLSIGKNLQTWATVTLSEPVATGELKVTITSSDPSRLLLSRNPEVAGTASITLVVRPQYRESPEFWLQAMGDTGQVSYAVTAPGYAGTTGTVDLFPAGVVLIGPHGENGPPEFTTTPRGWPTKLMLRVARLDKDGLPAEAQYVRGGMSLSLQLESSDAAVGGVSEPSLTIAAATDSVSTHFKPTGAGKTSLRVKEIAGFRTPASLNKVMATVRVPGIAIADDMVIGENLQLAAALALGEPAAPGGVTVTLTSGDPSKLLLSTSPTQVGKATIDVRLEAGAVSTTYYLQSLSRSGDVSHQAKADGYASRTGTLTLAPSGVILSLEHHGPPDEAEFLRPESAGSKRNKFVTLLSQPEHEPLIVYTAYLHPESRRSADITVQPLRAGLSLTVDLENTNPDVGKIEAKPVIQGGADRSVIPFRPKSVGETVISVVTPEGFTTPSNATELLAIVR